MSDSTDPLAALYAETGAGDDEDLPTRETTLDELTAETGAPDEISDADVDELALLVLARIDAGTMSDDEAVALGLCTLDADGAIVPNDVGRRTVSRAIELRFGMTLDEAVEGMKQLADALRALGITEGNEP